MRIRLTKNGGFEILKPKAETPTIVERAKSEQKRLEENKRKSIDPKDIKTTKPRRMYRKDFADETAYFTAVSRALKGYLTWAKQNGKLK